mgnify:CR=1 FL=1
MPRLRVTVLALTGFLLSGGVHGCVSTSGAEAVDERPADVRITPVRWVELKDDLIQPVSQYSTGPPVELRLHFDEYGTLEIRGLEDRTVCSKVVKPQAYGGYVTFKPGTTEPVGYSGRYGHCLKERARNFTSDDFRCAFSDFAKIEIHGYAWPAETRSPVAGNALSRRRAEFIWDLLETRALPTAVIRAEVHGTERSSFKYEKGSRVPGAYFRILDVGDPRTVPTPRFHRMEGPPLRDDTLEALRNQAAESTQPGFEGMRAAPEQLIRAAQRDANLELNDFVPWMSIDFVPSISRTSNIAAVRKAAMARGSYESHPLVRWGRAMLESNCDGSSARRALR